MTITKLLTGVAAAALLSSVASAQLVSNDDNGANDLGASLVFASELDLANAAPTGNIEVNMTADEITALNALAITDGVTVKFDLSGGLAWNGNLSDANHIGTVVTCEFNISADGGTGTQSVSYSLDGATEDPRDCDLADDLGFSFPIEITGTGNISYELSLTATGIVLESGDLDVDGAAGTQGYVRSAAGFAITVVANDANTNNLADDDGTTFLELDDNYELFSGSAATATVGEMSLDESATATIVAASNATTAAADINADTQIDELTVTVHVPTPAGILSATVDGVTVALDANGDAEFTFDATDLDDFDIASTAGRVAIILNADTTTPASVANQQISVSVSVSTPAASDLTIADSLANDVDALLREGSNTATFEWVGDSAASTNNVFRAVGLGATLPTIRVTLSNSNTAGMDGEYVVTPSNALSEGELVLTAADIEAAVGSAFGRADVVFNFEAPNVVVRRFMVTGGVIGDMGDDNG